MFVENLNTNVHSNLVCTRQRLVSTQASFNGWIVKQMEYVLQQFAKVKQQNMYTSNREPARGMHNLVACWGVMLSEKKPTSMACSMNQRRRPIFLLSVVINYLKVGPHEVSPMSAGVVMFSPWLDNYLVEIS